MYLEIHWANLQRKDLTPEKDLRVRCQMLRELVKKGVTWVFITVWVFKNLPEDFTRFSFFTILICPQSKIILFFIFVKKNYYFLKGFEQISSTTDALDAIKWLIVSSLTTSQEQTPRGHPWVNYICASVKSYERPTSLNHSYHLHESRWADTSCKERPTTNQSIELPWFNLRYRLPIQRRADELSIDLFLLCFL